MNLIDTLVEVRLPKNDDFLKIKETLTRMGISSPKEQTLYQSCHILHKQGRYYIVHFKEMFALDGKTSSFTDEDKGRRNRITQLLEEWNLLEIINPSVCVEPTVPISNIKVIHYKDKANWSLVSKYNVGKRKH